MTEEDIDEHSSIGKVHFIGVLHPFDPPVPGFVIPVFSCPDSTDLLVQLINSEDKVEQFQKVHHLEKIFWSASTIPVEDFSVGSSALFAFYESSDRVHVARLEVLRSQLRIYLSTEELSKYPFLTLEIDIFCDSAERISNSELRALHSMNQDSLAYHYFKQHALPRDIIRRRWIQRFQSRPLPNFRIYWSNSEARFELHKVASEVDLCDLATTVDASGGHLQAILPKAKWSVESFDNHLLRSFPASYPDRDGERSSVLEALFERAETHEKNERLSEAVAIYERVLTALAARNGRFHTSALKLRRNLARLYLRTQRITEARDLYLDNVKCLDQIDGLDPLTHARTLGDAAEFFRQIGDYKQSETFFRQAIEAGGKDLLHEAALFSRIYNNFGLLKWNQGHLDEAKALLSQSLKVDEEKFGSDHPVVALRLNNLALIYQDLDQYDVAERMFQRSLAIRKVALPANDKLIGQSFGNLASLYHDLGRYEDAEIHYLRSLEIIEQSFGPDHIEVAERLNNLASLFNQLRKYERAESLLLRALEIVDAETPGNRLKLPAILANLSVVYRISGRFAEAIALLLRSLEISEQIHGRVHPDVASALNSMGQVLVASGQFNEAAVYLMRALAIREQCLGLRSVKVAETLNDLALAHGAIGMMEEARSEFERALAILNDSFPSGHPELEAVHENYVRILHAQARIPS